jgi:hypothetical protein
VKPSRVISAVVMVAVGLGMALAGAWLLSVPAGLLVSGVLLVAAGLLLVDVDGTS